MANKPFNFIALDGADENGTRAEVYVQLNRGTVKEIQERTDKGVADVKFDVAKLNHPIHGWIGIDTKTYEEVKRAKETGEEVEFRIESQRKPGIDRKIPMSELRKDMSAARDNTRSLLVGVNDIYTDELMTNPNEDPNASGGRYPAGTGAPSASTPASGGSAVTVDQASILERLASALTNNLVRQPVIDQMVAQALFHGVDADEIAKVLNKNPKADDSAPQNPPKPGFSFEAQPWKEYNTDGRLNLGNNIIAGSVGIENVVYKQIEAVAGQDALKASNVGDVTGYFGELLFAITDSIQRQSYGEGAKVDRSAMSHVRIRGIVYDVVDRVAPLPIAFDKAKNAIVLTGGAEAVNAWISVVGKTAKERFHKAVQLSTSYRSFREIVAPASLLGGEAGTSPKASEVSTPVAPASEAPAPAPVAPVVTESVAPAASDKASIADLQALVNSVPTDGTPVETKAERVAREASLTEAPEEDVEEFEVPVVADAEVAETEEEMPIYGPNPIQPGDTRDLAGAEEVSELKALFSEYGYDLSDPAEQARIVALLKYTFGEAHGNAKTVPAEELMGFIDHYAVAGHATLHKAMELAVAR
jgi:hypothetical protein